MICLLSYTIYDVSGESISVDEKGTVMGMLVILPVIFILINIALRTDSQEISEELEDKGN